MWNTSFFSNSIQFSFVEIWKTSKFLHIIFHIVKGDEELHTQTAICYFDLHGNLSHKLFWKSLAPSKRCFRYKLLCSVMIYNKNAQCTVIILVMSSLSAYFQTSLKVSKRSVQQDDNHNWKGCKWRTEWRLQQASFESQLHRKKNIILNVCCLAWERGQAEVFDFLFLVLFLPWLDVILETIFYY